MLTSKQWIQFLGWLLVLLLLLILFGGKSHCAELPELPELPGTIEKSSALTAALPHGPVEWLYSPFWIKGDRWPDRTLKILSWAAFALDQHSTYRALDNGAVEVGAIASHIKTPWKRTLMQGAGNYGVEMFMNALLTMSGGSDRLSVAIVRGTRAGYITRNVWQIKINYALGR